MQDQGIRFKCCAAARLSLERMYRETKHRTASSFSSRRDVLAIIIILDSLAPLLSFPGVLRPVQTRKTGATRVPSREKEASASRLTGSREREQVSEKVSRKTGGILVSQKQTKRGERERKRVGSACLVMCECESESMMKTGK